MFGVRLATVLCRLLLSTSATTAPVAAQRTDRDAAELRELRRAHREGARAVRRRLARVRCSRQERHRYARLLKLRKAQAALGQQESLTGAEEKRLEQLATVIEALEDEVAATVPDFSEMKSLAEMEAAVRKQPPSPPPRRRAG
jgi:hypothetical protein